MAEPKRDLSAEQYFAAGNYAQAARAWQQEAVDLRPAAASRLRIRAADAWLLDNQPAAAKDLLKWISREDLDAPDKSRLDLVLADLALRQQRTDEAELHLRQAEPSLPHSSQARYEALSMQLRQLPRVPALQDISQAASLSQSISMYNPRTALDLLKSLEYVPSGELAVRADNPRADRRLTG